MLITRPHWSSICKKRVLYNPAVLYLASNICKWYNSCQHSFLTLYKWTVVCFNSFPSYHHYSLFYLFTNIICKFQNCDTVHQQRKTQCLCTTVSPHRFWLFSSLVLLPKALLPCFRITASVNTLARQWSQWVLLYNATSWQLVCSCSFSHNAWFCV